LKLCPNVALILKYKEFCTPMSFLMALATICLHS